MALRGVLAAETISVLLTKPFTDYALPTPPGPTLLWGPGSIPDNLAEVCGFLKPPGSDRFLESEQARCILHPTKNTRLATD